MPVSVALAVMLQLSLAATFVVMPIAVYLHGGAAQCAAEVEAARQGAPVGVLAEYRIRLDEKAGGFVLALTIAACLTALAALNLAGNPTGQILSWIAEPIVLAAVGFVCAGQVFAVRHTQAAFNRSDDRRVRSIDARAVMSAAMGAMPWWIRPVIFVRFGLATLGSLLVIGCLVTRRRVPTSTNLIAQSRRSQWADFISTANIGVMLPRPPDADGAPVPPSTVAYRTSR